MAGPVVACAFCCSCSFPFKAKDSKKMSAKKREELFLFLKKHSKTDWALSRVSEKVIDRINILNSTKLAMQRAVLNLERKVGKKAELLLIDGNFGINLDRNQKWIIKGDEKVPLISFASVVSKVKRDRMMKNYHQKYPEYGFDKHKGYGTSLHFERLREFGPCSVHRKSFAGLGELLQT